MKAIQMITIALGLVLLAGWRGPAEPEHFTFTPQSRLWIEGTSTLHYWTCEVTSFEGFVTADPEAPLEGLEGASVTVHFDVTAAPEQRYVAK